MPQEKVFRVLVMTAATAVTIIVLRMASTVIAPMLMALFLTIVLVIPMRWLKSKGCPEILSLVIVLVCTGIIFAGIGQVVVSSLNDFSRHFPGYRVKIIRKVDALDQKLQEFGFIVGNRNGKEKETDDTKREKRDTSPMESPLETPPTVERRSDFPEPKTEPVRQVEEVDEHPDAPADENDKETKVEKDNSEEVPFMEEEGPTDFPDPFIAEHPLYNNQRIPRQDLTELNTETFLFWVGKTVVELQILAKTGFLVMIITIFMLFEARRFPEKVDWALGKTGPINNEQLHHIAREIRRYLFIKSISCAMSATAATLIYLLFGVPGAFFWGLVAFFLYYIPNLGGIIASIVPGLLIFMTYDLEVVVLYAVILASSECLLGYGVEPKMLGHGLGISTVVIILSLLTWGWIFGPIGLFLAAPLTIMVKIILQTSKETEWIAILLGDKYQPPNQQV